MLEIYPVQRSLRTLRSHAGTIVEVPLGSALIGAFPGSPMDGEESVVFEVMGDQDAEPFEMQVVAREMGDDVTELEWSQWIGRIDRPGRPAVHLFEVPLTEEATSDPTFMAEGLSGRSRRER